MEPEFLYAFDTTTVRWPNAMVQAANGKIYATVPDGPGVEQDGYIWEYDPVLDTLIVRYYFSSGASSSWLSVVRVGLVEGPDNMLYGFGRSADQSTPLNAVSLPIFKYNTLSNTIVKESAISGYYSQPNWYNKNINGKLTPLPDGRLMLAEARSRVLSGAIGIADTITSAYVQSYTMDQFHAPNGYDPNGPFVEVSGLYYSTTNRGAFAFEDIDLFSENGYGTIFSYDVATNTYTKLHEFTDPTTGFKPFFGLVKHSDSLLYGLAWGGVPYDGDQNYPGVLFSFDPLTSNYEALQDLGQTSLGVLAGNSISQLLSATNNKLYGTTQYGIYEYDPVADTTRFTTRLDAGYGAQRAEQLIQICRKPNYKQRPTSNYSVCTGSYFAYDLLNVNATTVVWRRNGIVEPNQTNQRLEFAAIMALDAGIWSCTMTNECGTTEPRPITIVVNAGTATAPTITGPTAICGPTGSVVLTGNVPGGIWSNGATSANLTVTEPGQYQVLLNNACGSSYTNIITIERAPILVAPEIGDSYGFVLPTDSVVICPEYPYALYGNGPGWWNDVPIGIWHTPSGDIENGSAEPSISADQVGDYFITVGNVCGSDTSLRIRCKYIEPWPLADITYTNVFGELADNLLCAGDSVLVTVNYPDPVYTLFSEELGSLINLGSVWISDTTRYYILAQGPCAGQASDTLRFQLQIADAPPTEPALIIPDDVFPLIGCDNDSTYLSSATPYSIWSWVDADGMQHTDTAQQLLIDWGIGGNGFYSLTTYNGCGESPSDAIQIQSEPTPVVSYTELLEPICINASSVTLSSGLPPNGVYSGAGVIGSTFDPAVAGVGPHVITYSVTSGNCTGHDQAVVMVDACLEIRTITLGDGLTMRIQPNPNNGRFSVIMIGKFSQATATLYNVQGQQVMQPERLMPGANALNETDLAPGVYQLRIEIDGAVERRSIVVSRY